MLSAQPWAMGASCPVEIILQPCVSFSCLRQGFAESADPGHCCGGEMVICWYLLYSYDIWYIYILHIHNIYDIYMNDICINVMQGCTFDLPVIQWSIDPGSQITSGAISVQAAGGLHFQSPRCLTCKGLASPFSVEQFRDSSKRPSINSSKHQTRRLFWTLCAPKGSTTLEHRIITEWSLMKLEVRSYKTSLFETLDIEVVFWTPCRSLNSHNTWNKARHSTCVPEISFPLAVVSVFFSLICQV